MKVNYKKVIVLGIGYFGISAAWATYNAFLPVFLANRFHLGAATIGIFMALDNIAALLIQPPVGSWSDHVQSPIGRRAPFILVGAPIAAAVLGVIPIATAFPVFIACSMVFLLSMAFWRTPFFALLPDLTPSNYRSQANGVINSIGVLGALLAFLGGAQLYRLDPAYPFWLSSGLLLFSAVLILVFLREEKIGTQPSDARAGIFTSLREVWTDRDKSVLLILLAILLVFISNNALDAFITLYTVNHLGLAVADGARLMGQLTVAFVLFAIPAGFIGSRVGRRWSISVGIAVMAVCGLLQYLLPASSLTRQLTELPVLGTVPLIGLTMMLSGIGWALIHTNSLPMVIDVTTPNKAGTYIGLYYLASTAGAILGPILTGWVIQLNDMNYGLTMLVGPFFLLLALLMMVRVRRGEAVIPLPGSPPEPARGSYGQ
jgi:maltose/moltooligosaccharide transporter